MINLDEWAEIRRLHRSEDLPIKAIARKLGVSKNTVRRALRAQDVPRYQRAPNGSIADAAEPEIREQLRLCPTMPATVVAERIGWDRSITVLREKVGQLRPLYLPQDPAGRTAYEPGGGRRTTSGSRRRRSRWATGRSPPGMRCRRCW